MTNQPDIEAIRAEMRKALKCLYIAVPSSVADDVKRKVLAYETALLAEVDRLRMALDEARKDFGTKHQQYAELQNEVIRLRKQVRWIPVGERLPEHAQVVLCAHHKHGTLPAIFLSDEGRHVFETGYPNVPRKYSKQMRCVYGEITHWMPLPTPPEAQP